jgi:hypothetical protein
LSLGVPLTRERGQQNNQTVFVLAKGKYLGISKKKLDKTPSDERAMSTMLIAL